MPRQIRSLPGIIYAPFLHASYQHLAANTLPLLILGGILCGRSRGEFVVVTVAGILLGGGLTWLFARNACHIGASGLIFCYFGYLASLAYFNRTFGTLCLSVVCIVGYGGIVRGIVPTSAGISWESHLSGLVAGIACGFADVKGKEETQYDAKSRPRKSSTALKGKGIAASVARGKILRTLVRFPKVGIGIGRRDG